MTIEASRLEAARARLVSAVSAKLKLSKGTKAGELIGLCPFHNEKTPSFTVSAAKGFYHCFGCGAHGDAIDFVMRQQGATFTEAVDILVGMPAPKVQPKTAKSPPRFEYVGLAESDDMAPQDGHHIRDPALNRKPDAVWTYRNEAGHLVAFVCRWNLPDGKKDVRPRTLWREISSGRLVWRWAHPPHPKPLYGLERLRPITESSSNAERQVIMVEGEKVADAARTHYEGIPVLSWMGGTGSVSHSDVRPLAGRKVTVWGDNDPPGQAAAVIIARMAREAGAAAVMIVAPPPDLKVGWDLADDWPYDTSVIAWTRDHLIDPDSKAGKVLGQLNGAAAPSAAAMASEDDGGAIDPAEPPPPDVPESFGRISPDDDTRPVIKITKGHLEALTLEAEAALLKSGANVFQRGGALVNPVVTILKAADGARTHSYQLALTRSSALRAKLDAAAQFTKWDARSKGWVNTDCPTDYADILLTRGVSNLRPVVGVVTAPTLRFDGSVLEREGYDEQTGLLYWPGFTEFPPIPARPTREQATDAAELMRDLLQDFPFVTGSHGPDEAVALAGFATALVRRSLMNAPLHAISSPTPASGKSFLVDLISTVATGHRAPVASITSDEDETEKRLNSYLLASDAILSLDNASVPLGGDRLCQILSQEVISMRPLGATQIVQAETSLTIFATGNNLAFAGDVFRRCVLCRLDPQMEHPETREFSASPLDMVKKQRGKYVAAVLTMLTGYFHAGQPNPGPALASFEHWCRFIRDALIWLGFTDPVESMVKVQATDVRREEAGEILHRLWLLMGSNWLSVREIIAQAGKRNEDLGGRPTTLVNPELHDAIAAICRDRTGALSTKRLGQWLRSHVDQIINGRRLTSRIEGHEKIMLWHVDPV